MSNVKLTDYTKTNPTYKAKQALLLDQYKNQTAQIEQNKKDQQQAAAISQQKLLKYLPEYNAAMGLKGSGASETALLDANARYRSQQGQIAATYDAQQAEAKQNYNNSMLNLYTEAQAEEKAEQESAYQLASDTIQNWSGTKEELTNYVERELKGKMSDDQYNSILNQYKDQYEIVAEDQEAQANQVMDLGDNDLGIKYLSNGDDGENFRIIAKDEDGNDKEYKVQLGATVSRKDVRQAANNGNVGANEVFGFEGELYYMDSNGNIRRVEHRWTHGKATNEYIDLKTALGMQSTAN